MVATSEISPRRRWQNWMSAALSIWLAVSPWALQHDSVNSAASEAAWVVGFSIFAVGLMTRFRFHIVQAINNLVLGFCLIISPWGLGYAVAIAPTSNAVIVGAIVSVLALWEIWDTRDGAARLA